MFFDPNQHDPAQGAGQLPVGAKQLVVIESHSLKGSQSNQNNGFVELILRVIEGQNQGRSGADRLNLQNQNQTAVDIANKRFSGYCHAVGHLQPMMTPDDIVNLYNKPFRIDVEQDPKDERYTNVTKIYDQAGNAPVFRQMPTQVQAQPSPTVAPQAAEAAPQAAVTAPTNGWAQQQAQAAPAQQAPPAAAPSAASTAWGQQAQASPAAPAGNAPVMGWGQQR